MSLESIFAGIEQAHAQKLARAREAYVALVRRLHQSPDALDDEPEILVGVLNEVGKTPAALKSDVELYAKLRRLAALAARHAPASAEHDQVRAERDALREEWKSIEAEWAERFRVVDSKVSRLQTEFRHAIEAEHDLVVHQHSGNEQRALERQGRHPEARALGERAHRLELLARAFFPPAAPEEPAVVRSEGCSWRVGVRGGDE